MPRRAAAHYAAARRLARRLLVAAALPLACGPALAAAQGTPTATSLPAATSSADRFQAGNRLYQEGDYPAALDAYLGLFDDGLESGELHYNIGNAYFKLGEMGRAILFYERARRELPGDESVRANLELARSLTADQITPLPGFWLPRAVGWAVRLVPRGWLITIMALGYFALAATLLYRLLSAGAEPRPWTTRVAVAAAAVTLASGANLLIREFDIGQAERGVILQAEAAVQSAPSDDPALHLFTIHEGAVVRIDRRAEAWLEIVLEDGKVGWVRAGTLETI